MVVLFSERAPHVLFEIHVVHTHYVRMVFDKGGINGSAGCKCIVPGNGFIVLITFKH